MTSSISVIVPTFNRAQFLPDALSSLLAQSRPVAEIIVWDDGSTDDTETVVQGITGPIRYFQAENGGKSRALNAAIEQAQGDYIWICDDDDIALPDAAKTLGGLLDSTPAAGVAGGSYRRFRTDPDTGARIETGPGYWPDLSTGSPLRHLLEDIFIFQNATMVRRACYDAVGPFREDLPRSIDYDMIVRLAARFPVALTEDALFLQRKHDGVRGPAGAQHAAAKSDDVWKQADRAVFAPFRDAIPLSLYRAMFDADAPLAERAALLQRANVYARRTDWDAALDDFRAAVQACPDLPLSDTELAICRRAMAGKHGCAEAYEPDMRRKLAALPQQGPAGADVTRALARGTAWRFKVALRERKLAQAARIARFCAALSRSRPAGDTARPTVTERDLLPEQAYAY
ncbi:glycosyltransferase family 2 protein [Actibacterium ureilyticum]|uniref:glycosyltransferase family 2 protein n=1 Tax=Actibacterium ureilyticum TaxID=1590614 RepID=UPI000BAAE1E9|nr:glycosyltransferase family 2 protein [Actibacterium ureilyticum]